MSGHVDGQDGANPRSTGRTPGSNPHRVKTWRASEAYLTPEDVYTAEATQTVGDEPEHMSDALAYQTPEWELIVHRAVATGLVLFGIGVAVGFAIGRLL